MSRNIVGGLFFVSLIFLSSFFGCIFMMGPTLPLLVFKPSWFRWVNDKFMKSWLVLPSILFGMKLFITTENSLPQFKKEKAVIIMNHRTRLDWLYYWSVILRQGKLENEKIILKNGLKHIPGAGWAMQTALYIFIKRKWETDQQYLHQILRYFTNNDYPLQLLIFPEGTDYDGHTASLSKAYAIKHNLPIYKNVLHPRLRGFTYCVEQLRQHHGVDAIYDVTVGYQGNLCRSESDLVFGNFPGDVHFHIKRYSIEQIPESVEGLENWCTQKWFEKEKTLEAFYRNGKFDFKNEEKRSMGEESSTHREMVFWLVYWLAFIFTMLVLLYLYTWVRWYAFIVCLFYLLQSAFGGGFEVLQVWRDTLSEKYSDHQNNYSTHSYADHSFENGNSKPHSL